MDGILMGWWWVVPCVYNWPYYPYTHMFGINLTHSIVFRIKDRPRPASDDIFGRRNHINGLQKNLIKDLYMSARVHVPLSTYYKYRVMAWIWIGRSCFGCLNIYIYTFFHHFMRPPFSTYYAANMSEPQLGCEVSEDDHICAVCPAPTISDE